MYAKAFYCNLHKFCKVPPPASGMLALIQHLSSSASTTASSAAGDDDDDDDNADNPNKRRKLAEQASARGKVTAPTDTPPVHIVDDDGPITDDDGHAGHEGMPFPPLPPAAAEPDYNDDIWYPDDWHPTGRTQG